MHEMSVKYIEYTYLGLETNKNFTLLCYHTEM